MDSKSIARNHLSEAAKKGRYGDNILVHMNKDEAAVLAKSAGLNSLPINPKTGLQEAWVMAAAGLALGAYSAWKGGKMAAGQDYYYFHRVEPMDEAAAGAAPNTDFNPAELEA